MQMLLVTNPEIITEPSFRSDFDQLEIELGHIPAYDEEQESEIGDVHKNKI